MREIAISLLPWGEMTVSTTVHYRGHSSMDYYRGYGERRSRVVQGKVEEGLLRRRKQRSTRDKDAVWWKKVSCGMLAGYEIGTIRACRLETEGLWMVRERDVYRARQ